MTTEKYTPRVNAAKELSEISKDFTHPRELVRELIANALDACASEIHVKAWVDDSDGEDELIITVRDDGVGMARDQLPVFFDLGYSKKRGDHESIGEKGHGTMITYNSSQIRVVTRSLDTPEETWTGVMKNPLRNLARAVREGAGPPEVELANALSPTELPGAHGTLVEVRGYDRNNVNAFAHGPLKDYVLWFTAWGRVDALDGGKPAAPCRLFLHGLGEPESEEIPFGHPFAEQDFDFRSLRKKDSRRPENHFVRHFCSGDLVVQGHPTKQIQVFFSVEGDYAKRDHNIMLKRRGRKTGFRYEQYRYGVQERYGIYLCKDFIPIERKNEQFSATSAWTKWHAFVNCQGFHLTANRSSVDNTPAELLEAIYNTAREYIDEHVLGSDDYERFAELMRLEEGRRKAEKERKELKKRRALVQKKNPYRIEDFEFLEPRNEQELTWLLAQLWTRMPNSFPWERVLDHDARFGYDMLVERTNPLTGDRETIFVELKHILRDSGDFNHSFDTLWMIVCWESMLTSEDAELTDIQGKTRQLRLSPPTEEHPYTRSHLACPNGGHLIEIVALKSHLAQRLGMLRAA